MNIFVHVILYSTHRFVHELFDICVGIEFHRVGILTISFPKGLYLLTLWLVIYEFQILHILNHIGHSGGCSIPHQIRPVLELHRLWNWNVTSLPHLIETGSIPPSNYPGRQILLNYFADEKSISHNAAFNGQHPFSSMPIKKWLLIMVKKIYIKCKKNYVSIHET